MRTVAVTGGIGSGKSTICRVFRVLGIPVFEADRVAKQSMVDDAILRDAIVARFGEKVMQGDELDRSALAAIVFNDVQALADLNALVHPVVRDAFRNWTMQQTSPYVIMEAAILAETGGYAAFDSVVVVSAPVTLRIERVMKRDGGSEEAVVARMRNQASEAERLKIADHVIHNNDRQLVIPQVLALHRLLMQ
jgi:dephospho-CoA kinase